MLGKYFMKANMCKRYQWENEKRKDNQQKIEFTAFLMKLQKLMN